MSYFIGSVFSKSLKMDTGLCVFLPQETRFSRKIDKPKNQRHYERNAKTLILLHGMSGNSYDWIIKSRICLYAEEFNIAVIMPDGQRSFYTNMKYGPNYYTYIVNELPELVEMLFHVSTEPENLAIAGLSMGGYGALTCSLTKEGRYSSAAGFSAGIHISNDIKNSNIFSERDDLDIRKDIKACFGENADIPKSFDLSNLLELVNIEDTNSTSYYISCGDQDPLYSANAMLAQKLANKFHKVRFETLSGKHEWNVWEEAIQNYLHFWLD